MSCSNSIINIKYPNDCYSSGSCQELIYDGPPLSCIDVQTDTYINEIIKNLDSLICETLDGLKTTTTTTTTIQCFYNGGTSTRSYLCLGIGEIIMNTTIEPSFIYNGKPRYQVPDPNFGIDIQWSNTNNRWEFYVSGTEVNGLYAVLNTTSLFPDSSETPWTCIDPLCNSQPCSTSPEPCLDCSDSGGSLTVGPCSFGTITATVVP